MDVSQIPASGWAWFLVAALALLNLYNAISSARKNARDERNFQDLPTSTLAEKVAAQSKMLGNDKLRLDEHERQINDIRRGQMAMCRGVQALLEHELHNGNSDKMEGASQEIAAWLHDRP